MISRREFAIVAGVSGIALITEGQKTLFAFSQNEGDVFAHTEDFLAPVRNF